MSNGDELREREVYDDWGSFHSEAHDLHFRLIIISLFGTFVSGFLSEFENIYVIFLALLIFFASAAAVGYDKACAQIGEFARNRGRITEKDILICSSAHINFSEKYGYRSRPTRAALKLYFDIVVSSIFPLLFMVLCGISGVLLARFIFR